MSGRILVAAASLALTACGASVASEAAKDVPAFPVDQQAFLEACEPWDDWGKPAPPFRIYGNSYYVGTCGISAILVTGEDGHILIDGASIGGGPLVEANIEKLGFSIEDVGILLYSHEHFDHVGGLAYLQERSKAQVIAAAEAVVALETGQTQPDDPQFGMHDGFEPVSVARTITSMDPVALGKIALLPLQTPGHTPGALTWQWWSCERTDCRTIVYADSLSPISSDTYRFADHPDYLARYREGVETLAGLPCDFLLTPHPSASKMIERLAAGSLQGGMTCSQYAQGIVDRLDTRLAKEAADQAQAEE